ncbi:MAG: hypothetical protein J5698_04440 [Bacteroidaceae bacterium]|nr:hypothetical protein [Bacteroidaceae bacterium]
MKTKRTISILTLAAVAVSMLTACMNDFDDVTFKDGNYPFGNNALPADPDVISLQDLKTVKYASLFQSTAKFNYQYTTIEEDLYVRGRIVSNDESGNVYKTLAIRDAEGGCIVLGVNATGLYAYLPMGQEIILSLKGLDFGAYSNMPEIGKAFNSDKYGLQLGRMSVDVFESHVRLVGKPDASQVQPVVIDERWLRNEGAVATNYPLFVKLEGVTFNDGGRQYAPTDGTTEDRYVKVGSQQVDCRMSNYSNFSQDTTPKGKVNITGLLTLYGTTKQLLVRVVDDVEKAE